MRPLVAHSSRPARLGGALPPLRLEVQTRWGKSPRQASGCPLVNPRCLEALGALGRHPSPACLVIRRQCSGAAVVALEGRSPLVRDSGHRPVRKLLGALVQLPGLVHSSHRKALACLETLRQVYSGTSRLLRMCLPCKVLATPQLLGRSHISSPAPLTWLQICMGRCPTRSRSLSTKRGLQRSRMSPPPASCRALLG